MLLRGLASTDHAAAALISLIFALCCAVLKKLASSAPALSRAESLGPRPQAYALRSLEEGLVRALSTDAHSDAAADAAADSGASEGSLGDDSEPESSTEHLPQQVPGQEIMAYAQALKPLLVTRKDLARVMTRIPASMLLGHGSAGDGRDFRELLETVFRSVVVVTHVRGIGDYIAFGNGIGYLNGAAYSVGRIQTSVLLRTSPNFVVPLAAAHRRPNSRIDEEDEEIGSEESHEAFPEQLEVKIVDISSRDLFLAELLSLFAPSLLAAMSDPRCSERILRRRRRALRRAKEALSHATRAGTS